MGDQTDLLPPILRVQIADQCVVWSFGPGQRIQHFSQMQMLEDLMQPCSECVFTGRMSSFCASDGWSAADCLVLQMAVSDESIVACALLQIGPLLKATDCPNPHLNPTLNTSTPTGPRQVWRSVLGAAKLTQCHTVEARSPFLSRWTMKTWPYFSHMAKRLLQVAWIQQQQQHYLCAKP